MRHRCLVLHSDLMRPLEVNQWCSWRQSTDVELMAKPSWFGAINLMNGWHIWDYHKYIYIYKMVTTVQFLTRSVRIYPNVLVVSVVELPHLRRRGPVIFTIDEQSWMKSGDAQHSNPRNDQRCGAPECILTYFDNCDFFFDCSWRIQYLGQEVAPTNLRALIIQTRK